MSAAIPIVLAAFARAGIEVTVDPGDRSLIWDADREPTDSEAGWITRHKADLVHELTAIRLDFETSSPLDLTEVGTPVYVHHPDTRVLLMSWCVGADDVAIWRPGEPVPPAILTALDLGGTVVSHGAFDRIVWATHLVPLGWPMVPMKRWSDTSARARAYRAPPGLEKAARRLDLVYRKDAAGKALIRRASAAAQGKAPPLTADELAAFARYAVTDVETLRELDRVLPELSATERETHQLDARINERGLPIDLDTVHRLHAVLLDENRRLVEQMYGLCGFGPTQNVRVLDWLKRHASRSPVDLKAETLERWLVSDTGGGLPRDVVRTRAEFASTAGTKLKKMLASTSADGRARECFVWHGAHTGRWSGRGFQPQNLPRQPKDFDFGATLAGLLYEGGPLPDAMSVKARIAACLRGMIKAPRGMHLVMADFAQIESRVLCWLAGQETMLDLYRRHEDPYIATARLLGSDDRQFGKLMVLAAGFGGGPNMLLAKAPSYKVNLSDTEASSAIHAWRGANPRIVAFWNALHEAMREAVDGPAGQEHHVDPASPSRRIVVWRSDDDTLRIRLPSGRHLIYHQPRMKPDEDHDWRFHLTYQQSGPGDWLEKQSWRGLVTENVVQGVAYDLMATAMLRLDTAGIEIIGCVHDEVIALAPCEKASVTLDEMLRIMSSTPDWADGLPLAAEGYHNARYMKPGASRPLQVPLMAELNRLIAH